MSHLADLSSRQWELLTALARGETEAHVAVTLQESESSVHDQVTAILDKLGVSSRDELVSLFRSPDAPEVPGV
jgi:DNA-binding NarL/FixJ family response regulator